MAQVAFMHSALTFSLHLAGDSQPMGNFQGEGTPWWDERGREAVACGIQRYREGYARRSVAWATARGASAGRNIWPGLSMPRGSSSAGAQYSPDIHSEISEIGSKLAKTASPIARSVCGNERLSCSANASSSTWRTPCQVALNSISSPLYSQRARSSAEISASAFSFSVV